MIDVDLDGLVGFLDIFNSQFRQFLMYLFFSNYGIYNNKTILILETMVTNTYIEF